MNQELKDKVQAEAQRLVPDLISTASIDLDREKEQIPVLRSAFIQGAEFMHSLIGGGWIDCKDRLPEHGDSPKFSNNVLMYNGRMINGFYCFMDSSWNDYDEVQIYNVTHWQPLPLPPTENKND